jgi:hypothetical protein
MKPPPRRPSRRKCSCENGSFDALDSVSAMPDVVPELSPAKLSRSSRHVLLDEVGVKGQRKLAAARVLVIGAGGLGRPAACPSAAKPASSARCAA